MRSAYLLSSRIPRACSLVGTAGESPGEGFPHPMGGTRGLSAEGRGPPSFTGLRLGIQPTTENSPTRLIRAPPFRLPEFESQWMKLTTES